MDNQDLQKRISEAMDFINRGDTSSAMWLSENLLAEVRNPLTLQLMARCLMQLDGTPEAIELLKEGLALAPRDPRLLHDLGMAYSNRGQWHAAAQAYIQAIELDPEYAQNYLYLGPIYEQVGDLASAERAYLRALQLNPELATAAASLASIYEKTNRIESAHRLMISVLEMDPTNTVANLTQAQLDYREGNYRDSIQRLEQLLTQDLSPWNRSIAASRMGTARDKLGQHEQAFAAFRLGKQALLEANLDTVQTGIYAASTIANIENNLDALLADRESHGMNGDPAPVFLLGFPRSGTTLLDQILSSHPGVLVLEEKNTLRDSLQEFVTTAEDLQRLVEIDEPSSDRFRKIYWSRVGEAAGEPPGSRLLIDKLPLYTAFMPVIHKIIPNARFIFAIRDPRDVVLSCFMQAFGLNEAMRHFLTLQDTADYYAAVMKIGIRSQQYLGDRIHVVKYETLIDNLETEARRLCGFLGLDWDEQMLRFHDIAKGRRINTPSYSQVVQPVYRSALGRWRHYEAQLQPVLTVLQPYIESFGYA